MLVDRKIYYWEWVFYTPLVTIKPLLISQKFTFLDTLLHKSTVQFSKSPSYSIGKSIIGYNNVNTILKYHHTHTYKTVIFLAS